MKHFIQLYDISLTIFIRSGLPSVLHVHIINTLYNQLQSSMVVTPFPAKQFKRLTIQFFYYLLTIHDYTMKSIAGGIELNI